MFNKDLQRFRPQQTTLSGGTLLVLNSGIHFGYTFYDWTSTADDSRASWTKSIPSSLICLAMLGWFMGSILGFILAPLSLRTFSSIKVIYVRQMMQVFQHIHSCTINILFTSSNDTLSLSSFSLANIFEFHPHPHPGRLTTTNDDDVVYAV